MNAVLVFCGSNTGNDPIHAEQAKQLGYHLAETGKKIIYGAGNVGLMGILADAALAKEGYVIGIIPHFLKEKEVCHNELTELYLVSSMDERKVKMAELSDSVIVLPGGYGTLDELFEMLTLVQLNQANHPIGILNTNGYYDHMIQLLDRMHSEGFLKLQHRNLIHFSESIEDLIQQMEAYSPPPVSGKWI